MTVNAEHEGGIGRRKRTSIRTDSGARRGAGTGIRLVVHTVTIGIDGWRRRDTAGLVNLRVRRGSRTIVSLVQNTVAVRVGR
jgi:hypothetical protein